MGRPGVDAVDPSGRDGRPMMVARGEVPEAGTSPFLLAGAPTVFGETWPPEPAAGDDASIGRTPSP